MLELGIFRYIAFTFIRDRIRKLIVITNKPFKVLRNKETSG